MAKLVYLEKGSWLDDSLPREVAAEVLTLCSLLEHGIVDAHWLRFFERAFLDLDGTRDRLAAELDRRIREVDEQLRTAEREVAKLADRRARLDDDYLAGKLGAESFERFSARLTEEEAAATAERDRLRASAEEARRTVRKADAEEETLRRLAALRDAIAADARRAQESGDLDALRAISRELAEEVTWAVDPDGGPRIVGVSPGSRLYRPVADPAGGVAFALDREHVLPLSTGEKNVSGSGVPE